MNDGRSAFPREDYQIDSGRGQPGMTLRDWFAGHAPEMTEQWFKDSAGDGQHWLEAQAAWSYAYADAMIAERDRVK